MSVKRPYHMALVRCLSFLPPDDGHVLRKVAKATPVSVCLINAGACCLTPAFRSRKSESVISGGNGSGANAAICWRCDDRTDEAERSGQDDGVLGVHVSQVQVQVQVLVQGIHTYSGLVDGVVECRLLCHVVVGKWGRAGEAHGLSLDSVKDICDIGVF